jgi:putative acetyltransferase
MAIEGRAPAWRHKTCEAGGMEIRLDDLRGPEVHVLLRQHLQAMTLHSPPESIHALDLDALRRPEISFWTAWDGTELLGCGALKALDAQHGEIKSMRTATPHLRKGVARALLLHILAEARQRGTTHLSLETGTAAAFEPAHRLYASVGFVSCGPFGQYVDDPFSVFMTLAL